MTRIARVLMALLFAGFPGAAVAAGADLSNSAFGATPYTLSPSCDLGRVAIINVTLRNSGDATTESIPLKALDVTKELTGETVVPPIAPGGVREVQLALRASTAPSAGAHVITVFFAPLRAMKPLVVQVPASLCVRAAAPTPGVDLAAMRAAKLRALRSRAPITTRFAVPSLLVPGASESIFARSSEQVNAIKAELDYQRKCDATAAATPARIDRVRGPVSPGIVLQIAGDCFGSGGKVELLGLPSGPLRLAIQSWSRTAISATVPGVRGAGHQSVVLAVTRAASPFAINDVNSYSRTGATPAPSGSMISSATSTLAEKIDARSSVRAAAATLRPNETAVEFWPEVERRTANEAVINRSCAFRGCINGNGTIAGYGGAGAILGPLAYHEDASTGASGLGADGVAWLHSGEDVWVINHPAGWYVDSVSVSVGDGVVVAGQVQEADPRHAVLPIRWQDRSQGVNPYLKDLGSWFVASYAISVTLVGPKGTWPQ